MKNIKISLKGIVESRSQATGKLRASGDSVLVQRGVPRLLLLMCPCGCGHEIPINLDARAGKAWRLYHRRKSGISLFPSVWLDSGCKSHFIIWRDKILLLGRYFDDYESPSIGVDLNTYSRSVLTTWPSGRFVPYTEVADLMDEIPWDVLQACRHLVKIGLFIEGTGQQQGTFQRIR